MGLCKEIELTVPPKSQNKTNNIKNIEGIRCY